MLYSATDSQGRNHTHPQWRGNSFALPLAGLLPPLHAQWEANMLAAGAQWGDYLTAFFPAQGTYQEATYTYYDSQRVFYNIAEYTGNAPLWEAYALEGERVYLNYTLYSINDFYGYDFSFPGYRRFSHGFLGHWARDPLAHGTEYLIKIRDNPAYSNPDTAGKANEWYWVRYSREVAYALSAHVNAEKAGLARNNARLPLYVAMALSHVNEWVTGQRGNPDEGYNRFAPFMAGLTSEALIEYYEWEAAQGNTPDNTIPNALQSLADFVWSSTVVGGSAVGLPMWVPDVGGTGFPHNDTGGSGVGGFRYEDRLNTESPGDLTTRVDPDLGLLLAPLYAWLYMRTGDVGYIDKGDLIWEGCVALASVDWNTKIFNQSYRWSFDYMKWRNQGLASGGHV